MIEKHTLIAFDLETTGFDARTDKIIEIGAVKRGAGEEELSVFSELVRPGRAIPAVVAKKTGITDDVVAGAPALASVLQSFAAWLGSDGVLLAHNAEFDAAFLVEALDGAGIPLPPQPIVCTLKWAVARRISEVGNSLDVLGKQLDLYDSRSHRALADAKAVLRLADHLWAGYKSPERGFTRRFLNFRETAANYNRASKRQLDYLVDLGASPGELDGITKDKASRLIDRLKRRRPTPTRSSGQRRDSAGCSFLASVLLVLACVVVATWF